MNGITIGTLARSAGVGVETVRYYQRRGLLPESAGRKGAFRVYGDAELARLRSIRRAQTLGFSLDEIADLLALDHERDRENARALARSKIASVEERIRQLEDVRSALQELVDCCGHTEAPAPCPILRALGGEPRESESDSNPASTRPTLRKQPASTARAG
ncbi:MerR family transcriptional regulator [Aromatoleum sp.]|uniref:MerR family transcriptional regulator n=1 Tax=Aromatoleum sp. TaxID=2307007 RepID=UPI002FC94F84